jgi:DNA-binding GntR family transcriptional regulator
MAQPIRFAFLSRDPTKSRAVAEHAQIIALIEDGDIAAAAAAMEAHVMRNVSAVARLFG